jgi:two-component system, OmpR family, sensor kinase
VSVDREPDPRERSGVRRSLRLRLVAGAGGAILAAVAVFAAASLLLVGHQLRSSLDSALRRRALSVAQLAVTAPGVLNAPGAFESTDSGRQVVVEVLDSRGRILGRSPTLGARLLPAQRLEQHAIGAGRAGFESTTLDGHPLRVFAAPIAQAGGPAAGGAVLVASDTSDIHHTLHHLIFVLALSGGAIALAAVLLAALLTRRELRPLARLVAAAGEIERTADVARRLPEPAAGDEIAQLTGVLNRMLASLERARDSERRFLADASHELRTPITTLRGNVEYAVRHGADPEVLQELARDAVRLSRLVDDLLVLEREGSVRELHPVALDRLVSEVVAAYGAPAGVPVEAGMLEPVTVEGDPEALRRALGNLIDNAIVHGPAGGRVVVDLTQDRSRARLSVADEGSGPDPARAERLFERFWRGPEAGERPGSGLGLAIVAAITERHHGTVTVDGSRFTIELPTG